MRAGRAKGGSVAVMGARAVERVDVPGAGAVAVPVGEEARPGSRPAVVGDVMHVAVGGVRVPVMPVVGVPVAGAVGVPMAARRGRRRVVVGARDREEGDERPEREPRREVAVALPAVMMMASLPGFGGAGKGEHGREGGSENESGNGSPHRASPGTEAAPHRRPSGRRETGPAPFASDSPAF